MKTMILILISLIFVACAPQSGSESGTTVFNDYLAPEDQSYADPSIAGAWNKSANLNDSDLTINDDGTIRINQCGTTYKINGTVSDTTYSTHQSFMLSVQSYDFVQDGCLRPNVGDFSCKIVIFYDPGLNRDVFSLSCDDDNFYHTPYSKTWFRQ